MGMKEVKHVRKNVLIDREDYPRKCSVEVGEESIEKWRKIEVDVSLDEEDTISISRPYRIKCVTYW